MPAQSPYCSGIENIKNSHPVYTTHYHAQEHTAVFTGKIAMLSRKAKPMHWGAAQTQLRRAERHNPLRQREGAMKETNLQSGRILSCPPTSHTVKLMFLYSTVSTLKPMVGMVVTISPSLSLYKIVVLPAASRPTIRMRISFLEKRRLNTLWKAPMVTDG